MRALLVVLIVFALAFSAFAREIDGATVTLTSPTSISAGQTYLFEFWVQNDSSDAEWIKDVYIIFPDGFTLYEETMDYDEIVAGRPSWDMYIPPVDHTTIWEDNDGGYGEIYSTEGTSVRVEATTPDMFYGTTIFWELFGDEWGAEPHHVCGCIDLNCVPVQSVSWTSIKAMYR